MSYKVEILTAETSESPEYQSVGELPYSFSEALSLALENGDGLRELDWAYCREVTPEIQEALSDINDRFTVYLKLCGSREGYKSLVHFFEKLNRLAKKYPEGVIKVS